MLKFESVFKNHFESNKISDDNLAKFALDHISRLQASAEPALQALVTEVGSAHADFTNRVSNEDQKTVQRISLTHTTDELIQDFKAEVSRQEGLIRSMFGKDTPEYLLFFPQGVSEYANAVKANVQTLMERIDATMQAHANVLPQTVVSRFSTLSEDYRLSRSNQLQRAGDVSTGKASTASMRTALELALLRSMHTIAASYPGNVVQCTAFFDQSIINYNTWKTSDGIGRAVGTITASGEPLSGATVSYKDAGVPVVHTKHDGTYRARNVAIGPYTLVVSKHGYHTAEVSIDVIDDGDTLVDVELEKE